MVALVEFFLNNFFLIVGIGFIVYIYKQYQVLKKETEEIEALFTKSLDKYLEGKINEAKKLADEVAEEYKNVELINSDLERLRTMIDKGIDGSINDKVETSNIINKFKINKKIDIEKYPNLLKLKEIGTFSEEDMGSVDNGIAITRHEYNTRAFQYNEKANGFPIQYFVKLLKLNSQFIIFDQPRSKRYEELYEVFEEDEPDIDSLSTLNREGEEEESLNELIFKVEKNNKD